MIKIEDLRLLLDCCALEPVDKWDCVVCDDMVYPERECEFVIDPFALQNMPRELRYELIDVFTAHALTLNIKRQYSFAWEKKGNKITFLDQTQENPYDLEWTVNEEVYDENDELMDEEDVCIALENIVQLTENDYFDVPYAEMKAAIKAELKERKKV